MSGRPDGCGRCDYRDYAREKIRRLEADVEGLRAYRAQLERILALALVVSVGDSGVEPTELLRLLEQIDEARLRGDARYELASQLLRETDPAGVAPSTRRRAA
jgi:hypothetical protein